MAEKKARLRWLHARASSHFPLSSSSKPCLKRTRCCPTRRSARCTVRARAVSCPPSFLSFSFSLGWFPPDSYGEEGVKQGVPPGGGGGGFGPGGASPFGGGGMPGGMPGGASFSFSSGGMPGGGAGGYQGGFTPTRPEDLFEALFGRGGVGGAGMGGGLGGMGGMGGMGMM